MPDTQSVHCPRITAAPSQPRRYSLEHKPFAVGDPNDRESTDSRIDRDPHQRGSRIRCYARAALGYISVKLLFVLVLPSIN
jgi:hypothetical protein